ncbi:MAG TPA: DEAD/DEAH box helicase [Candidatus Pacearchaeota archaeon]|nr:DEAD/DEAH box helicase [Candidatus Pacearchaeota archaeon]
METFAKLGLGKGMLEVLNEMRFEKPSEIQEKTIPLALTGRDIIGGSATGSGKTLAFASPIVENLKPNGHLQALILTPTRELAEQVAHSIAKFSKNTNLNTIAVYGGTNIDTQIRRIPQADVLVGTPGRIIDHLNRRTLNLSKVKFLVLDEVDRMFDMGFSRDVEKIIKECPKDRQTMMFSATVSQDIDYLAKKYSKNPAEVSVESFVDPSKLKQFYYDVPSHKKFSLLVHLLKEEESRLVLVFCSTRRNVDFVTKNLLLSGVHAKAIHGGLEQKKRLRVLQEFQRGSSGVLVCTGVAARGLDIKGVSHVYNYDIPSESKEYIHRIGRTARAGEEGKAISILSSRDYENFRAITERGELKIKNLRLPQLEIVRIRIDSGNERGRRFGGARMGNSRGNGRASPRRFGGAPKRNYGRNQPRSHDSSRNRGNQDSSRSRGPQNSSRKPMRFGQGRSKRRVHSGRSRSFR